MDKLIRTIISSAIPPNESLKSSDFSGSVSALQEKITDTFRYCSLQFLPPFLDGMLTTIRQNSNSQDKKTRFSSAICITALINLFPNDENVFYYRPIIEKLLIPGYRPIVEIGTLVLDRFARISGPNRDRFLSDLIEDCCVISSHSASTEAKYTAAVIWKELAHSYPEGFYHMKKSFLTNFFLTIENPKNEKIIYYLLIGTMTELFQSEAASVGVKFLRNFHESLLQKTIEIFSNGNVEKMSVIFELMLVILDIPPYIDKSIADKIYPKCVEGVNSKRVEIVTYSVNIILYLLNQGLHEKSEKLIKDLFDKLLIHVKSDWRAIEPMLIKLIIFFSNENDSIKKIDTIYQNLPKQDAALYVFNLTFAVLQVGKIRNISSYLDSIIEFNKESKVPIPIHSVLKVLNVSYKDWYHEYSFFKNKIIHAIRQELSKTYFPNDPTDKLIISLQALHEIPSFSFINAIELKNLIMKLTNSKDSELRELIASSIVHLFKDYEDQIPLDAIFDLVRFALNDRVVRVRKKSLKAFTPITYRYLEQQDIFNEFCKFSFDESPEIRKEALNIIKSLKTFDLSVMRNRLLSSINLINSNFGIIVPEITPVWVVFPNLINASKPVIHIYAESFFNIFHKMLTSRFIETKLNDTSLVIMNSAILKEIDESLIKSVTKLYLLCPEIVPVKQILDIFCSVLKQLVHPWTKENVLKSLKNIAEKTAITDICPDIFNALQTVIQQKESIKLVTKALKVMGVVGVADITISPEKEQLFFRSSLANPLYYNQYILRIYFKYLNDYFDSNNIDLTRRKIAFAVVQTYYAAPGGIQAHLEPFLTKYLNFIKNSTTERITDFLHYLEGMICTAGYLIIPYTDRIFQAIEEHWHNKYTKESSKVFTQLVKSTEGHCDSILHLLVSASFLLLRSKKEIQESADEIFHLLREIAHYCPDHLHSIIDGCVKIMSTPGSPVNLQQLSLQTIEYIIKNVDASPHLSMITRCLYNVSNRSQMIWRNKANKLLDIVNSFNNKELNAPIIQTSIINQNSKNTRFLNNTNFEYFENNNAESFDEFVKNTIYNFKTLIGNLIPPKKDKKESQIFFVWFDDLCKCLIECSGSGVIKTMKDLPTLPYFAFKFAFYAIWPHFSQDEKKEVVNKFNDIFINSYLPSSIMSQFIGIVEFAVLAEMDLGVDLCSVINTCISYKFYAKACFFLENYPEPSKFPGYIQKLINLNISLCRSDEARCLANDDLNRAKVDISVWMALSEWEKALELVNKTAAKGYSRANSMIVTQEETDESKGFLNNTNSNSGEDNSDEIDKSEEFESVYKSDYSEEFRPTTSSLSENNNVATSNETNNTICFANDINADSEPRSALAIHTSNFILNESIGKKLLIRSVQCLASMENWKEIKKIKPILLSQSKKTLSKLARFMWMAELFQGTKEEAIECVNLTGGYTVADCIDKSILYIHFNMLQEAKESFHLAWRYLASSICNLEKNNKQQMVSHIFQAEQLHELSEVIDIKNDPSLKDNVIKSWRARLRFIREDPEKQKELYKIRSLVSDTIDPTEFAYSILQSSKRTSKGIEKLIDLFFPDPNSYDSKYCRILLIEKREDRISEAKKLLNSIQSTENCEDIIKRLNNFIGKESFEIASSFHDLDQVSKYLKIAQKNYNLLAQVQILRSLLLNDENIAVDAIKDNLDNCIDSNIAIVLHQLEAMTIHFPNSKKVYEAVIDRYKSNLIKASSLKYIERTCVLSLNNPNKYVVESSRVVCSILAKEIPETIFFELLSSQEKYPKLKVINDLLNILQSNNSLFYSQMIRIVNKLDEISHTLFDKIIDQLRCCFQLMNDNKYNEAYKVLNKINKSLKHTNVSRYDNEFKERFKRNSGKILEELINKVTLTEIDKQTIQKVIVSTIRKQDAVRVIQLSSLDVELGTKTNWSVPIFGASSSKDLKINKFFHSVQRLDNGLRIAVFGSDGKKYSFHLLRGERIHINQSEQFMTLLNALTSIQFTQRSMIEIKPNLTLTEFLKGRIQLFDLISMYQQSKGQNPDEEFIKMTEIYTNTKTAFLAEQLKLIASKNENINDLKKVLLITSKNATSYINKTTMFAKSMGTLAAVSYIIGGGDNSPRGILMDKTTGEVAYANFRVTGVNQEVPFRLTKMVVSAFGPCGVNGPFMTALVKALKGVRKYLNALATCVQFALGDEPFYPQKLPKQYLGRYSVVKNQNRNTPFDLYSGSSSIDIPDSDDEIDVRDNNPILDIPRSPSPLIIMPSTSTSTSSSLALNQKREMQITSALFNNNNDDNDNENDDIAIDKFYKRVSGIGKNINREINHLINKAQSFDKLAKMPVTFYAWW